MDLDGQWLAEDSVESAIEVTTSDCEITIDSDIDWDVVPTVDSHEVSESHRRFFDSDRFYRFDVTVARPIPQQYVINDNEYTFLKPKEELQRTAWSVENSSYVITHPTVGYVTDAQEIHGFFHNVKYDTVNDDLNAKLTVPQTDDEALEYLSTHSDVSLGFYNTLDSDTDGDVDAYQRNIICDHVASVERGRCNSEQGCGVEL